MFNLIGRIGLFGVLLALAFMIRTAAPVNAQDLINPTAESVQEEQLLNEAKRISGFCSIPDQKACTLEQPRGRDWRYFKQIILRWLGVISILGMFAVVTVFYLLRGTVHIEPGRSGRTMLRFSSFERFVHWMAATCFIILMITGLNLTFGRELLLPLIGPEAFAAFTRWGKYAHNFLSFPFALSVVCIAVMWFVWNLPSKLDIQWMMEGGGFGKKHPPADFFNAGQKSIYWIVVLGGGLVIVSGYVLMFPFYGTSIVAMQVAQIVHSVIAVLVIAGMVFHIYMGSIGEEGAFESMWEGTVDENWAKQHHSVWHEREMGKSKVSPVPTEGKIQPAE
jgi:formate dehydrogenase subunit gamma